MKSGSWTYIVFVYLCGLVAAASAGVLGPIAQDISAAFSVTPQDVGLAIAAQLLPLALAGLLVGWVINSWGARAVLRSAAVGIAITAAINHWIPAFDGLRANLIAQGIFLVGVMTAGQVTLTLATSGRRQVLAMTLWATVMPIGYALGLFMVSPFAGSPQWREVFLVHAGLAAVLMLLSVGLPAVEAPAFDRSGSSTGLTVLRNVRVLRLGFGLAIGSMVGLGTNAVLPMYLQQQLGAAPSFSAQLLGVASFASVAGSALVGFLLGRGAQPFRVALMITGVAVSGALLVFLPTANLYSVVAGVLLLQFASGACISLCFSMLPMLLEHPGQTGPAAGLVGQITGIGATCSAPIFFYVLAGGSSASLGFVGVTVAAWFILLLLLPTRRLVRVGG